MSKCIICTYHKNSGVAEKEVTLSETFSTVNTLAKRNFFKIAYLVKIYKDKKSKID